MFKHFSKIILHCVGHPFVAQNSFCLKEPLWLVLSNSTYVLQSTYYYMLDKKFFQFDGSLDTL